jgi:predicted ribosome quality control (RQC) complex YloA/Tae2 family protein
MKKDLSSLEIHYMLKELKLLIDQKIDKIYHPHKNELILQFHVTGKGKHILRIIAGKYLFLTDIKEESKEPSGFCMFLRKHISNARLREINQLGSERIVEFIFEKKQGKEILIIEFFSNGNIILTDDKYTILSATEYHKWKDREIKAKLNYQYPKKPANIFNLKLKDIKDTIKNSNKEGIVKTLAIELGFGGLYSEELCLLTKIDKNKKPNEITDKDIKNLLDTVSNLLKNKINAQLIYKEDDLIDAIPFNLELYNKNNKKESKTFSQALDFYVNSKKEVKKTPKQKQIEKLQRIIEKQKEKIIELEQKEKKQREKAELIYNNYKLIDEILKEIKKASEKYSWKEIKEKLKGHNIIKDVNMKDKKITIKLQ